MSSNELAQPRRVWSIFQPGSIMLADRPMCAWTESWESMELFPEGYRRISSAMR